MFGRILSCLSRTSPNFFYFKTCLGRPWGRRLGTNSPPGPIFAPAHPQAAILGAPWGANGWRCSKPGTPKRHVLNNQSKSDGAMVVNFVERHSISGRPYLPTDDEKHRGPYGQIDSRQTLAHPKLIDVVRWTDANTLSNHVSMRT